MRIDLLHYAVPPVVGGVESVIAHHARLMTDAGHQVRLLAGRGAQFDAQIPYFQIPLADSLHIEIQQVKSQLDQGIVSSDFYALVDELERTIGNLTAESDFLIAHNVCSLNKNLALTAALQRIHTSNPTLHFILWHHDLAWATSRYQDELHPGYPWGLIRMDWPGTTQVVVSRLRQAELSSLTGIEPDRIFVVPNGIDIEKFFKLDEFTSQLIRKYSLLKAEPLFVLPVRITPRKNIELALRIIHALRMTYPNIQLIVTGPPGPHNPANIAYFEKLRMLRSELGLDQTVLFLAEVTPEYIPDPVIFDFYHLADALILPSREEGFGIPILEAGLSGMPVFCSAIPTLQELGGNAVSYFLLESDPVEIASQIASKLADNLVVGFRMKVRSSFTWERVYQDHIAPLLV